MLSRFRNINSEQEAKFIQNRISLVERNVAELCQAFGAYSRKAARLRDKGDEISSVITNYAESEDINKSLSLGLANFATAMTSISDVGEKRVQNIDAKIVKEFSQYENICKKAKEEVKQIFIVRDKEVVRKRQLDRLRERNPKNRQQIIHAETELVQATAEVSRMMLNLENEITTFERQKLHDIKTILLDFISTEIGYHAKAIEFLTGAYNDVYAIDEEGDLEDFQKITEEMELEFKKATRMSDVSPQNDRLALFRSSHSLGSLGSILSTPKKKSPGYHSSNQSRERVSRSTTSLEKSSSKNKRMDEYETESESD